MALILVFHNDATGGERDANYNIQVIIGDGSEARSRTIETGRVEKHNRGDGWAVLVRTFLDSRPEGAAGRTRIAELERQLAQQVQRTADCSGEVAVQTNRANDLELVARLKEAPAADTACTVCRADYPATGQQTGPVWQVFGRGFRICKRCVRAGRDARRDQGSESRMKGLEKGITARRIEDIER